MKGQMHLILLMTLGGLLILVPASAGTITPVHTAPAMQPAPWTEGDRAAPAAGATATGPTTAVPIEVSTGTFAAPAPGAPVQVPVILSVAPDGLSGYDITVALADPSVAWITAVSFPDWATLNSATALPADQVRLRAADVADQVTAGRTEILLATLTVRGARPGATAITITPDPGHGIEDDGGFLYTVVTPPGLLTVGGPASVTVSTGTTVVPGVGATAEVPIVLDAAPLALAGYKVTVALADPSVAEITDVAFPAWAEPYHSATPLPGGEVTLSAVDLLGTVPFGATDVVLATLTVRGTAPGATAITVTPDPSLGIEDAYGNLYDVTAPPGTILVVTPTVTPTPPDDQPPVIVLTSPADGAVDVPVDTAITVAWDEPVSRVDASIAVDGAAIFDAAVEIVPPSDTFTFPPLSLPADQEVTVTITSAADQWGNENAVPTTWSFTTALVVPTPSSTVTPVVYPVYTGTFSVPAPGATVQVPVLMPFAPNGLSGYKCSVALGDPAVAEILSVSFPSWATLNGATPLPAGQVTIKAADFNHQVGMNAHDVVLATLTLRGRAPGATAITVTPDPVLGIQDEQGNLYTIGSPPGHLTVGAPASVTVSTGTTVVPDLGATAEVPIVLDAAPAGLAGYEVTVALADPAVAEITAVAFPAWAEPYHSATPLPAGEVTLSAVDLYGMVPSGVADVVLATLTVRGTAPGTSAITVTPDPSLGIEDTYGNLYDVTAPPGAITVMDVPPAVVGTDPADGASGIPPDRTVEATFSEPVQYSPTDTTVSITLFDGLTSRPIQPLTTFGRSTLVFGAFSGGGWLEHDTTYTLTIAGVRDLAGTAMTAPYAWTFATAANQPPVASVTAAPTAGLSPLTVAFDGSASSDPDGSIPAWTWDWGDGSRPGSGTGATHTYTGDPGQTFTATLTVMDDDGATATATAVITLQTPAEATEDLRATVESLDLPEPLENALTAKLDAALAALDRGAERAAISTLNAFINQVNAKRNAMTPAQADALVAGAQAIIDTLQA